MAAFSIRSSIKTMLESLLEQERIARQAWCCIALSFFRLFGGRG